MNSDKISVSHLYIYCEGICKCWILWRSVINLTLRFAIWEPAHSAPVCKLLWFENVPESRLNNLHIYTHKFIYKHLCVCKASDSCCEVEDPSLCCRMHRPPRFQFLRYIRTSDFRKFNLNNRKCSMNFSQFPWTVHRLMSQIFDIHFYFFC